MGEGLQFFDGEANVKESWCVRGTFLSLFCKAVSASMVFKDRKHDMPVQCVGDKLWESVGSRRSEQRGGKKSYIYLFLSL